MSMIPDLSFLGAWAGFLLVIFGILYQFTFLALAGIVVTILCIWWLLRD
jgi:hypothetical protein